MNFQPSETCALIAQKERFSKVTHPLFPLLSLNGDKLPIRYKRAACLNFQTVTEGSRDGRYLGFVDAIRSCDIIDFLSRFAKETSLGLSALR